MAPGHDSVAHPQQAVAIVVAVHRPAVVQDAERLCQIKGEVERPSGSPSPGRDRRPAAVRARGGEQPRDRLGSGEGHGLRVGEDQQRLCGVERRGDSRRERVVQQRDLGAEIEVACLTQHGACRRHAKQIVPLSSCVDSTRLPSDQDTAVLDPAAQALDIHRCGAGQEEESGLALPTAGIQRLGFDGAQGQTDRLQHQRRVGGPMAAAHGIVGGVGPGVMEIEGSHHGRADCSPGGIHRAGTSIPSPGPSGQWTVPPE